MGKEPFLFLCFSELCCVKFSDRLHTHLNNRARSSRIRAHSLTDNSQVQSSLPERSNALREAMLAPITHRLETPASTCSQGLLYCCSAQVFPSGFFGGNNLFQQIRYWKVQWKERFTGDQLLDVRNESSIFFVKLWGKGSRPPSRAHWT